MISTRGIMHRSGLRFARAIHRSAAFSNKDNVDPKEVDNFTKLGDDWWKAEGPVKGLEALNELRIPFVRDGLINTKIISEETAKGPKYLSGIKILDVGCGGGIFSLPLARLGADVTGLDPSSKLIQVAQTSANEKLEGAKIQFTEGTIEDHSVACCEHYDALVCSEVVEHVPNKEIFVNSCVAAVKPGGSLFFTTISQTLAAWFLAIGLCEYVFHILPVGTHQYDKLITSKDLSGFLERAGCNILNITGSMYNPITNKWSWCPSDKAFYALHAIKRYK